ncbi:MAG: SYNERG-CTERM sorting domain-containing protein [Synergistaceae bacterium]|nr:SYNERG-CTERM sorting domain-containing protein [Synergistaceae bacterium]
MQFTKNSNVKKRIWRLALALCITIMSSAIAFASWPARPYGAVNATLPEWFMDYQNSLFRSSGVDYSFLPLYKPGHGSSLPGAEGFIANDVELEEFLIEEAAASGGTMKWKNVFEYYAVSDDVNGVLRYEQNPETGERKLIKLPFVVFSKEGVFEPEDVVALKRPVIWLQGQIHGNEYSGGDAEQVMIHRLTQGDLKYVLDRIVVVMLPRANPEGAWRPIRGNNAALFTQGMSGQDPNRDNIWFESVLQRAVHKTMNAYAPHVVIDQHEQGAWGSVTEWVPDASASTGWSRKSTSDTRRLNDLSMLYAPHPVNNETITALGYEFEEDWRDLLEARGIRWSVYPAMSGNSDVDGLVLSSDGSMVPGRRSLPAYILEADGDPRMVDPSYGLKGAASYLSESSSPTMRTLFDTRVRGHNTVAESLLLTAYNRADYVYDTVMRGREEQAEAGRQIAPANTLQLSYLFSPTYDDLSVPGETITEYYATRTDEGVVEGSREGVKIGRMALARGTSPSDGYVPASVIQRPYAYIISSDQQAAFVDRFTSTGVRLSRLTEDITLPVTAFLITNRVANPPSSTSLQSDKDMEPWPHIISGECYSKEVSFKAGTLVMYMDQPIAPYGALGLDPQSCWNYANIWWRRTTVDNKNPVGYLPVGPDGSDFPTYKLMEVRSLPTENLPDFAKYVTGVNTITPKLIPLEESRSFIERVRAALPSEAEVLYPVDIQLPTQYTSTNRYTFDADELRRLVRLMDGDIHKLDSVRWFIQAKDGSAREIIPGTAPLTVAVDLSDYGLSNGGIRIFAVDSANAPSPITIRLVAVETGVTPDDAPPIPAEDLLDEEGATDDIVIEQDGAALKITIPASSGLEVGGEVVKFWFFRKVSGSSLADGDLRLEAVVEKRVEQLDGGPFRAEFDVNDIDGNGTKLPSGNYAIEFEGVESRVAGYTPISSTVISEVPVDPVDPDNPGGGGSSGGCDAGFGAFALVAAAGVFVIRRRYPQ